ncbi:MAG: hypothetical protein ACRDJU_04125 [Actinomycetota bacterium]
MVSPVGFGAMRLTGRACSGRQRIVTKSLAVLREAVAGGVDHIDTDQFYGPDFVNELIRGDLRVADPETGAAVANETRLSRFDTPA